MGKKTILKSKKRVKPVAAALLSGLAISTCMTLISGCQLKKNFDTISKIENDFLNNNRAYHEYVIEKSKQLESQYSSGYISLQDYLNKKNDNIFVTDIDSAIEKFADFDQWREYEIAKKSKKNLSAPFILGSVGAITSGALAYAYICSEGLNEDHKKYIRNDDELTK